MKQAADDQTLLFATDFSRWFEDPQEHSSRLPPGVLSNREARLKPAQDTKSWIADHRLNSVAYKKLAVAASLRPDESWSVQGV